MADPCAPVDRADDGDRGPDDHDRGPSGHPDKGDRIDAGDDGDRDSTSSSSSSSSSVADASSSGTSSTGSAGSSSPGDTGEPSVPVPPSRVLVRRPDDLLICEVTFGGVVFKPNPPRLERTSPNAFIVIEFPPQSFGEEAYLQSEGQQFSAPPKDDANEVSADPGYPDKNVENTEPDADGPAELPAARVRMAQPSRVAVTMPATVQTIGYDLNAVLTALRDWPMRLDGNAKPDPPNVLLTIPPPFAFDPTNEFIDPRVQTAALDLTPDLTPAIPAAGGAGVVIDLEPTLLVFGPREPAPTVTALELPYRLVTSPIEQAHWRHAHHPVEHRGRTELWHTRLTASESMVGPDRASRIRALWSPDYRPQERIAELVALLSSGSEPPTPNPNLIRMSLDPLDRSMLVTLMAGFDASTDSGGRYHPISSEAKRLHLSALGALLDAEGTWTTTPEDVDLEQWRHLSTLGRDQYVRVMYKGYLCPFGHAASLVKVTERRFESLGGDASKRIALLRQRFFIVVREPVRSYDGRHHTHHGRDFPITQVEILTRVTPDLAEPGMGASGLQPAPAFTRKALYDDGRLADRMLFWPMVPAGATAAADFRFELAATDIAGHRVTFSLPLLFVGKLADAKVSSKLRASYNATPPDSRRRTSLGGAVVSYAPADPTDKGDPAMPTATLTFRAGELSPAGKPNLYPEIDLAQVGIKSIQKLLQQPGFTAEVMYPQFYIDDAFHPTSNAGQVFLQLTSAKELKFGGEGAQPKSDSLGALASPQMAIIGLSKTLGPVSGQKVTGAPAVADALKVVKGGVFNPADFFKDATLLGGIKIAEIVKSVPNLTDAAAPKMLARDLPDRVESSFTWDTDVTEIDTLKLLIPRADPFQPPTRLTMAGVVQTPNDPAKRPSVQSSARLTNFKVNLFGFIILWFEELTFSSQNGQKPDVVVRMRDGDEAVRFGGPLEFVNDLRKFIPSNGFSDPPSLSVTPSGISAGYSLTLPAIGVGIFALSNASLGAAFSLPFDASPASVKFNFSRRDAPFSLTVSLLGGGGFFAIGVSAQGVNEIEAALEFGAAIAINLGVASGSVEVKAGIYFHWLETTTHKSVELAGYVRIHGELTVLGIISVSLTFNLQLGYLKQGKQSVCYGEATLTVEIEILMFSMEVSVKCRREFAGADADPRFIALMPDVQTWTDYCGAFAADEVA